LSASSAKRWVFATIARQLTEQTDISMSQRKKSISLCVQFGEKSLKNTGQIKNRKKGGEDGQKNQF
jgi:3-deoxy-D-manno-octulosonic-acid transferase